MLGDGLFDLHFLSHLVGNQGGCHFEQKVFGVVESGCILVNPLGQIFGELSHFGLIFVVIKSAHLGKSLHSFDLLERKLVNLGNNLRNFLLGLLSDGLSFT